MVPFFGLERNTNMPQFYAFTLQELPFQLHIQYDDVFSCTCRTYRSMRMAVSRQRAPPVRAVIVQKTDTEVVVGRSRDRESEQSIYPEGGTTRTLMKGW